MTPQSRLADSTDGTTPRMATCDSCTNCAEWCSVGREWPMPCGPCLGCGRETMYSAGCGYPHCPDCRLPLKTPNWGETEQQAMARTYAGCEWRIFPIWWVEDGQCACHLGAECGSPGKHPLFPLAHRKDDPLRETCYGRCGKLGHGLYDATNDPDTITEWWTRYPKANIGMPAHGNGFAIIDVDPKNDGDETFRRLAEIGLEEGIDLTATLAQHTGGNGMHYLYAAPDKGVTSKARSFSAPGVDTRGVKGYIVLAPSVHVSGGKYEWVDFFAEIAPWPDFLTELMQDPPPPPDFQRNERRQGGDPRNYGEAALEREVDNVIGAPEGTRNETLNRAAFNLGQLVTGGALGEQQVTDALTAAARRAGLRASEIKATIKSGMSKGKGKPRTGRPA